MSYSGIFNRVKSLIFAKNNGQSSLLKQVGTDSYSVMYKGYAFAPNPDDLVDRKGLEIYEQMMTDVEISNSVDTKRYSVIASNWEIVPASDSDADIDVANFIRYVFENVRGSVYTLMFEVLYAIAMGYSITEKVFHVIESGDYAGFWAIERFKAKNADDYRFDLDEFGNIENLRLISLSNYNGEIVNLDKFIVYTYNPKNGLPYGTSDLRAAYKHYWSVDFLTKWLNIYNETFAMPTRVAKIPKGAYKATGTDSQTTLQSILEDIMNNTAITIPEDITLEFKEASMGGAISMLNTIKYHNGMIKTKILGQTLTSGQGSGSSSYALGVQHGETKEDFVTALRRQMEDTVVNEQIIKQLVDLNFSVDAYPKFSLIPRQTAIDKLTAADISQLKSVGILTDSDANIIRKRIGLPPMEITKKEDVGAVLTDDNEPVASVEDVPAEDVPADDEEFNLQFANLQNNSETVMARRKREDTYFEETMNAVSPAFESSKIAMLGHIERAIMNDKKIDLNKVLSLRFPGLKAIENVLKSNLIDITGLELERAYKEVNAGKMESFLNVAEFIKVSITEGPAVSYDEQQKINKWISNGEFDKVRAWRAKKTLELSGNMSAQTLWVTDSIKDDVLKNVKQTIMAGVMNGAAKSDIMQNIGDVFEKYVQRSGVSNKALADAPSLGRVVRTNITRAQNVARRQVFSDPEVKQLFPALQYWAIIDDVTTEVCKALHKRIYATDDPIWNNITPPNHHNCRSTIIPIGLSRVPKKYSDPYDTNNITTEFGGTGANRKQ